MVSVPQNTRNVTRSSSEYSRLIALSDERDRWMSLGISIARAAYRAGRHDGWYAHKEISEERWRQRRPVHVAWGPPHAELEERRWGEGGRDSWVLKGPVRENGSFYGDR